MDEASIFLEALKRPSPGERAAFLDQACGGNDELRRSVELLLRAHDNAGGFLADSPAPAGVTVAQPVTESPGTAIGPYKLIEQIGEGGMGTVWMAQQTEPVRRLVALKVIKAGMDSKQVVARFEAERQALALMDHPNIARVLDGGTTGGGRPYFVMDLVKGVPITRYCDEHHLTPRQRLELFLPVCQAVQHAHQKGIIHRDLKPSNVLVALYDGKPVPKVIDFGVAKAAGQSLTEKTLVTGFGNIVGTLEYMSPEQAEINQLDIDTRSDIYSLGVLLYELLTGSPPFSRKDLEKAGLLEMLRVIREQEPSKPSTKLSTAEGLPTLAANRGTDPAKLTKLVRGELDWIVMKALEKDRGRRYETANGLAMDVQRYLADEPVLACPPSAGYRLRKFARRNRVGLAASGVIGLALLLAVLAIGWAVRDRSAREEAAQLDRAARQARLVGQVQLHLEAVARLQREQKWPDALEAACRAQDLVAGGEAEAEIAQRVQDAVRNLEFVRLLEDIRTAGSEWKERRFDYLGTAERYAAAFRDAGIDVDRLSPEEAARLVQSRPAVLAALIPALDGWTWCRWRSEDLPGARHLWKVARLVDPDPWRRKVRLALGTGDLKALLALAAAPDLARQPAATLTELGQRLINKGHADVALGVLFLAQQRHPADFWVHFTLGRAFQEKRPPSHEGAAGSYRAALALQPRSTAAWTNLGNALAEQKKLDEAIACFEKAIELDPKHTFAHTGLGLVLERQGKVDRAFDCCQKAIALDPKYAWAHYSLGFVLCRRGKLDEAIASFQKAIALDPKAAPAHYILGVALADQKKLDLAIASYQKAIALDPKDARAHAGLGVVLYGQGRLGEAIASFQKAIDLDPKYAEPHSSLGVVLQQQGRPGEAIASFQKAIDLDPKDARARNYLGRFLCDVKRDYDGAIASFQKAIELDPRYAEPHGNLGVALLHQGKLDEAIAYYKKAIALDPKDALTHHNLGHALTRQGKLDEAIASYRKAIELDPKAPGVHNILVNLALALNRQGKKSEARQIHEKEIAYLRAALQADPKNAANRRLLRDHYWQLADNAPFTHDELAKVAEEFPRILPGEPDECVRAAWYLCRCVSRVEKDDKLRGDERTKLAQRYAQRAVEMLRHSISKGNKDANRLKTDSAFAPLRSREDFQKLVAELEAKNK